MNEEFVIELTEQNMVITRATHNEDAISCYYELGEAETNVGQLESWEFDLKIGERVSDDYDWQSYETEEDIEEAVNEINNQVYLLEGRKVIFMDKWHLWKLTRKYNNLIAHEINHEIFSMEIVGSQVQELLSKIEGYDFTKEELMEDLNEDLGTDVVSKLLNGKVDLILISECYE